MQSREIKKRRSERVLLEHQYTEKKRQSLLTFVQKFAFETIPATGPSGLRSEDYVKFTKSIQELSEPDALALLESIKTREIVKLQKNAIFSKIIPPLSTKKARVTMDFCFANQSIVDPHLTSLYAENFITQWLTSHPEAAITWVDQKISENPQMINQNFKPSSLLLAIELPVIKYGMAHQPDATAERLKKLGKNDAMVLLGNIATNEKNDDKLVQWIGLVRKSLSPAECEIQLVRQTTNLSFDLKKVDHFMKVIGANEAEKQRCVSEVAASFLSNVGSERTVRIADVEQIRSWAATHHAPLPALTGYALGQAIGRTNGSLTGITFENARELLMHFHKISADDQFLVSFLSTQARFFVKDAREIADEIRDPEIRLMIQSNIK